jgi:hypothetical protein
MIMAFDRDSLTPSRIAALRQVKTGSVEYDTVTATYWIDDVKARGWQFRTLADLGRLGLVRRPRTSGRGQVKLTKAGEEVMGTLPGNDVG